jgi:hypothetical protein
LTSLQLRVAFKLCFGMAVRQHTLISTFSGNVKSSPVLLAETP